MGIYSYLLYVEPATLVFPTWDSIWETIFYESNAPANVEELVIKCEDKNMATYGYMDYRNIKNWNHIFSTFFQANPDVETITFHFWCSDEQIPFVFICNRNDTFELWKGDRHSIHWSKKRYENSMDKLRGIYSVEFSLEKYKRNFTIDRMTYVTLHT